MHPNSCPPLPRLSKAAAPANKIKTQALQSIQAAGGLMVERADKHRGSSRLQAVSLSKT